MILIGRLNSFFGFLVRLFQWWPSLRFASSSYMSNESSSNHVSALAIFERYLNLNKLSGDLERPLTELFLIR